MAKAAPELSDQPDREQLRRIVEGLSDGVILIEPDGRIVWANDAALKMHGCTEVSGLGDTVSAYEKRFDLRLRDGQPMPKAAYPMARLCRGEAFEDVVVDVRRAGQDEPDWVHRERGFVLDRDGAPDRLVLIVCDATEAFEAEERFESMFNANPAPCGDRPPGGPAISCASNEGFLELVRVERETRSSVARSTRSTSSLEAAEKDKAKARLGGGRGHPADGSLPAAAER